MTTTTTATVTCHTDGCGNADIPLDVPVSATDDDGATLYVSSVICGACGQEIDDVDPPLPDDAQPRDKGSTRGDEP